ncbi:hypothetical protein EI94DRAFT_435837 [Lactarius quietus]|nr:hypothetical protein EI94DRAFT_435837 [Lactarius quietus]
MPKDPPVLPLPPIEVASGATNETLHFDYPGADIVLRSFDFHDFRVPKLYIINSSPLLQELVLRSVSSTSDRPSGEEQEPLPIAKLPESGATLYSLLTLIFPVAPILPPTYEKIMELLGVAQKYQMSSALSHIRGIIGARKDPPFIRPETAIHIYFLAQQHQLHQEALQAARVTLRLPMVIEDLVDKLEFSDMTGAYLYELWKYHKRVRPVLKSSILEFRNSGLPDDMKHLPCSILEHFYFEASPPYWLDEYIKSIAEAPHLWNPIEVENAWARHITERTATYSETCSCAYMSTQLIHTVREALSAVIHKTIEKVCTADSTLALVKEEPISEKSDTSFAPLRLNVPEADVILRSSDPVTFRAHKSLLAMSSPLFEEFFSLSQPPDVEFVDGLPAVDLPEDADLLNSLISFLYPVPRVVPRSYEKVFSLLSACQKYDMVSIQSYIRDEVKRGAFPAPVRAQAFSAYGIASSLGLIKERDDAARLTLGQPMTFESLGEAFRLFKGQSLCELVHYRAASNSSSNRSQGPTRGLAGLRRGRGRGFGFRGGFRGVLSATG